MRYGRKKSLSPCKRTQVLHEIFSRSSSRRSINSWRRCGFSVPIVNRMCSANGLSIRFKQGKPFRCNLGGHDPAVGTAPGAKHELTPFHTVQKSGDVRVVCDHALCDLRAR